MGRFTWGATERLFLPPLILLSSESLVVNIDPREGRLKFLKAIRLLKDPTCGGGVGAVLLVGVLSATLLAASEGISSLSKEIYLIQIK